MVAFNGFSWEILVLSEQGIYSVSYLEGQYIATGNVGSVWLSVDGIN